VHGTGGAHHTVPNVLYPDLSIGGLAFGGGSLPVGVLPALPIVDPPVAGLVGGDLLSRFDVEFDLPAQRIRFWSVTRRSVACAGPPAWTGPHDAIAAEREGVRLVLPGRLDGQPIRALLDSGARSRILSDRAAARVGVGPAILGADPGGITAGLDLREIPYHWHRFRRLVIGGQVEERPVLTVSPLAESVDLLLGSDWLAPRDVWVSYATDTVFIRRPEPAKKKGGP